MPDEERTTYDTADKAEALDDDTLGLDAVTSDAAAVGYPPERPLGVHDPAVTPWGARVGESLRHRTWREEPDVATPGYLAPPDPAVLHEELELGVIADPVELTAEEAALHVEPGMAHDD